MNRDIKLKSNAYDVKGQLMKTNYKICLFGRFYSIIEDEKGKQYYINNKYIENIDKLC